MNLNVIKRFRLNIVDEQIIQVPPAAKPIEVMYTSLGLELLYVLPVRDTLWEEREIKIVATGEEYDPTLLKYIGMFNTSDGIMFHIFEKSIG